MKQFTFKADELKQRIASSLAEKFRSDGFVYRKTGNEFSARFGDYTNMYNIDQCAWTSSFSLHVRIYISQKQIQKIIEKILGKQRHTITMGQDIGPIYKPPSGSQVHNRDLSIWIREDADLDSAIESLEWYYNDIAKPYFEKYRTLAAMDGVFNSPPFHTNPPDVGGNYYERYMKGLVVARLTDNKNYEKLVEIYNDRIIATMNPDFINSYYKVRDFLNFNRIS